MYGKSRVLTMLALCCAAFAASGEDGRQVELVDRHYGPAGQDGLRTIAALRDGGFILAGWRNQQKPGHVGIGYIANIAADGSVRWDRDIVTNGENRVSNVLERDDGSLVLVVEEYPVPDDPGQAVLMKLSAGGKILEQRHMGGAGPDLIEVMRPTADGGYVFVGESAATIDGDYQGWIGKLSAGFETEWEHRLGEPGTPDCFFDAAILPDGAVIAVGMLNEHSTDENAPARPWAAKIAPTGAALWSKVIESGDLFALRGSVAAADGQVVLAGYSRDATDGDYDGWIGLMSPQGEIVSKKEVGRPLFDQLIALEPTEDGRFIAVGAAKLDEANFDLLLVRFSADGNDLTSYVYEKPGRQFGRAVRPLQGGAVAVGGFHTEEGPVGQQLWFLKTQLE